MALQLTVFGSTIGPMVLVPLLKENTVFSRHISHVCNLLGHDYVATQVRVGELAWQKNIFLCVVTRIFNN